MINTSYIVKWDTYIILKCDMVVNLIIAVVTQKHINSLFF